MLISFIDENGDRRTVTSSNPLPVTGSSGGGDVSREEWDQLLARVEALEEEVFPEGSPADPNPHDDPDPDPNAPTAISVDPTHVQFTAHIWEPGTVKLSNVTLEPEGAQTTLSVASSDTDVCTVTIEALQVTVKAWEPGEAVVTVSTANGLSAEIGVTVPEPT